jgi:hypothetical protein
VRWATIAFGLAACASDYVPVPAYVHGFPEHLACSHDDVVCRTADDWLAVIEVETGDPCGSVRANAYGALQRLGPSAAPALRAALDLESPAIANAAAHLLVELGRRDLLDPWCAQNVHDEAWEAACRRS